MKENRDFILSFIKEGDVCIEIGTWRGEFAKKISNTKLQKLYLIDPWKTQDYKGRWYSIPQVKMDKIYENVKKTFHDDKRIQIVRDFSENINFEKNSIDWIYIDGDHSYEKVKADLNKFYEFLKPNGYLIGDDYNWKHPSCKKGPGPAVQEFCKKLNLDFYVKHNQYVIRKSND